MSAELLRRAAADMRANAEAATDGPWWLSADQEPWAGDEALTKRLDADPAANDQAWDDWAETNTGSLFHGDVVRKPDAAHIASWHPAVALAVADWLDATADYIELAVDGRNPGWKAAKHHAESIARAYLGETS